MLLFEWDENKRKSNLEKHGLDFKNVKYVFQDEYRYTKVDDRKEYGEIREITIGLYKNEILTSICHTDRTGITRIISFRPASKTEKEQYYARKNSKIYK